MPRKRWFISICARSCCAPRIRRCASFRSRNCSCTFIATNPGKPLPDGTWQSWQNLLPQGGSIRDFDLRIEDGPTVLLLRNGTLSFSEVEAGHISVDEITIASPVVRQTFSQLRGATHWQEHRLTLAGLVLARGLDIQSVAFDLSRLGEQRLGVDLDLDAFGGKIRGDISTEWHSTRSHWNIAASATDISLGQTAEAIGLADRIAGRLHACKLTFRGDAHDPMHATASIWTELTAPAWRDREADVIMLGAALYNRQFAVQQLYVRQGKNQLTLSGEAPLPEKVADWLKADFHADITASIENGADFARLLGGNPEAFGGELEIEGTMESHGRKLGGRFTAAGKSLRLFNSPVDVLTAKLSATEGVLELTEFNLQRKEDFLRASGKIDLSHPESRTGSIELSMKDLHDYWSAFQLNGATKGQIKFSGSTVSIESLELNQPGGSVSFHGDIAFPEMRTFNINLVPVTPMFDLNPPTASGCFDRVQFSPKPKAQPPVPEIRTIDLAGKFGAGVETVKIANEIGEKEYHSFCPDQPNLPLQLGITR